MKKQVVRSLALATVLGCAPLAPAAVISWTLNANGSWGVDGNWNAAPAWDGTDDVTFNSNVITTSRTLTLDGNRTINSLTATSVGNSNKYIVNPGTPGTSTLTILTGNLTLDGGGASYARPLALTNTTVQIGDGVTPVTTAVWNFNNAHNSKSPMEIGAVKGIAGTVVTVQGNNLLVMGAGSSDFLGTFKMQQDVKVVNRINASNGFGGVGSTLEAAGAVATNLYFNEAAALTASTHDMNINVTSPWLSIGVSGSNAASIATINGNLTGSGTLELGSLSKTGSSSSYRGILNVNGSNNTFSGDVLVKTGTLRVDGDWTGAGNVTISHIYTSSGLPFVLSGSGSLTTAANKTILLKGNDHLLSTSGGSDALVAPGTDGVIGTLTLGTSGTGKLKFDARSFLNIDLDGILADQLVVLGDLDLNQSVALSKGNGINLNVLNALTLPYYTLVSYTGSLSGTFANVTGVPAGYSLSYDTPGEIRLVNPDIIPEPATLGLLAVGGLVMIRRHRRGD